ncbi:hypothetical protein TNCV_2515991 [Trichonephila clavipes]|nr:hypothetical protein TNCV_2515991 [Trichonephila clavipes]
MLLSYVDNAATVLPHQRVEGRHAFSPFINFGTANREVTHPVPPTNHSASYPPLSSQKTSLVSSSDYCVSPPPTPYHHFSYNDSPASQSGSFMLSIQDSTTTIGNIHCSVMGRRNAPRSMSQ